MPQVQMAIRRLLSRIAQNKSAAVPRLWDLSSVSRSCFQLRRGQALELRDFLRMLALAKAYGCGKIPIDSAHAALEGTGRVL